MNTGAATGLVAMNFLTFCVGITNLDTCGAPLFSSSGTLLLPGNSGIAGLSGFSSGTVFLPGNSGIAGLCGFSSGTVFLPGNSGIAGLSGLFNGC